MVEFIGRMKKGKKKYTLRKEMTSLMILTSACTLLSAVLAVFYVFFSFFFQKTSNFGSNPAYISCKLLQI